MSHVKYATFHSMHCLFKMQHFIQLLLDFRDWPELLSFEELEKFNTSVLNSLSYSVPNLLLCI